MKRFVYVFCTEDRDVLLAEGYELLCEAKEQEVYVFLNREGEPEGLTLPRLETDVVRFWVG